MYIVDNATLPNTTSKCTYYSIYGPILFHRRGKVEAIKKTFAKQQKRNGLFSWAENEQIDLYIPISNVTRMYNGIARCSNIR